MVSDNLAKIYHRGKDIQQLNFFREGPKKFSHLSLVKEALRLNFWVNGVN